MEKRQVDDQGKSRRSTSGNRSRTTSALSSLALVAPIAIVPAAIAACAGPPMTTPVDGEPVCADFEVGAAHTKMAGSLRFPVQLSIKSGDRVIFKTTLVGRRTDKDPAPRILLSDDNDTYTVEWTQCENERAAKPVESVGRDQKGIAKYECGTGNVYKTEQLTTKKGDPASHAITFPAPPNASCWQSVEATPPPPADAGAPDASAESGDAGAAAAADGGTDTADAGAASADAGPSDASAPSDAGAGETGKSDAGASKSK